MKVKLETIRLIRYLYPFIAFPLAFLAVSVELYHNYLFGFSIAIAISGFGVLSYNILCEKLTSKPKYSSRNYECCFDFKNTHNKLVLRYAS